jgi:hypothetical protein
MLMCVACTVTVAVLAAGGLSAQAGAISATPPHIVVKPDNVMVNTKVTLTGTGFPARARLSIAECSETFWIAPQNPCDTNNMISVLTDGHGKFVRQFRVELCPRVKTVPPVTEERCYIGEPKPMGVDTIRLIGAAPVTVTYP